MSWFVLIFIATNLFSINNLLDKFICSNKFKNNFSLMMAINLLAFFLMIGLSFFTNFSFSFGWPLIFALLSGPVYVLMWIFWYKALAKVEVSRAFAIFNTGSLFTAILAVIFLGESLTFLKWLAVILIILGAIICSYEKAEEKTKNPFNLTYLLVILASFFYAVANIFSKIAIKEISANAIYILSYFASLPIYLSFLRNEEIRREVKESLTNKKMFFLISLRVLVGFLGIMLFYLALVTGPVSLVSAVSGAGPVIVLFYTIILSSFFPKFIKEKMSQRILLQKALAILLIVGGVVLINF